MAERGIRTPGTGFSQYNGLANSTFHSLLFGINNLRSDEMPYFGAKTPVFGSICATKYSATSAARLALANSAFDRAAIAWRERRRS